VSRRTSSHAHINVVLSIIPPEALLVCKIEGSVPCLAEKLEMFVVARGSDKPHSISIQAGLNPDFGVMDCQRTVCPFVDHRTYCMVNI
jgi:hypothetical protein